MTLKNVLVNEYLQELTPHGTDAFPITVSHDDLTCFADRCIRCHWHDDLEIGLIRQGTVTYQAAEQVHTTHSRTGDCNQFRCPSQCSSHKKQSCNDRHDHYSESISF